MIFWKKPSKEKEEEKTGEQKQNFIKHFKKPGPDMIETYYIETVFGRAKLLTEHYQNRKKNAIVFNGITELPPYVRSVIPHVESNIVDGVYRVDMERRQSTSSIVTDAKGNSRVEKSLRIPVLEFVPFYMITQDEKNEIDVILDWINKDGLQFEMATLTVIDSTNLMNKLSKAKILFRGVKVRQDFDIAELNSRIKEIMQPSLQNIFILSIRKHDDPSKENSFMLIEIGKTNVQHPEHLLTIENVIDFGPQFAGMERNHLIAMIQKSIVIEYEDKCVAIIMPLAKNGQ